MDLANLLQHLPFLLIHLVGLSLSIRKFAGNNRVLIPSALGFLAFALSQIIQIANRFIISEINSGAISRALGITIISLSSAVYFLLSISGWICILLLLFRFMRPEVRQNPANA